MTVLKLLSSITATIGPKVLAAQDIYFFHEGGHKILIFIFIITFSILCLPCKRCSSLTGSAHSAIDESPVGIFLKNKFQPLKVLLFYIGYVNSKYSFYKHIFRGNPDVSFVILCGALAGCRHPEVIRQALHS